MSNYARINNLAGWLVFIFATLVYAMTMEAGASFWDCGEFTAAAYKQQVVHPPGAPIFLMVGRMFTLLAGGNVEMIPVMMNFFSALCSSFSILFLFWITTHFTRESLKRMGLEVENMTALIIGTGVIAGLTGTFLTSLWFSAVEAEVYAMATFFYALLFWAMTKWDRVANQPGSDRWLLFIALMIGLSGGVHLLSLLVIPALCFMYYFRRYEVSLKGLAITFGASVAILAFILFGLLDGFIAIAAGIERSFVNDMGMPFGSGIIFYSLLILGGIGFGLFKTRRPSMRQVNTGLLSLLFLLIGLSSYAMVLVRADARPSINMNGIDDIHSFLSYLKREQYGSRDLFSGPYFTAQPLKAGDGGSKQYYKNTESGKYEVKGERQKLEYELSQAEWNQYIQSGAMTRQQAQSIQRRNKTTIFPRMGSIEGRHLSAYYLFLGINPEDKARTESYTPNMGDNIRFFGSYQLGHMFWRYFMWNFSGRQNDSQGYLLDGKKNGNWITGIGAIDNAMHPHLADLDDMSKADPARNRFYLLPFLLGLLGMCYQFINDKRGFTVVFLMFFFMGFMNILNMNQPPVEPRERDYAMVGAFYAFAIWVGMGVMALWQLGKTTKQERMIQYGGGLLIALAVMFITGLTNYALAPFAMMIAYLALVTAVLVGIAKLAHSVLGKNTALVLTLVCLIAPALMGFDSWGNHDRSNRTFARDIAKNYLESCEQNAILFTQGDNDTYPLWYAQEVEGIRTDVRIINLSLLGVDWYINLLRRKVNDAPAVKMTLSEKDILGDRNNVVSLNERSKNINRQMPLNRFLTQYVRDATDPYLPTRDLNISVDKQKVIAMEIVEPERANQIPARLSFKVSKKNLYKNDLVMLDIVDANKWERPIYFAMTVQSSAFIGLQKYFQQDGMCYKLTPIENEKNGMNRNIYPPKMYDLIMSDKFNFGGVEKGEPIYMDPSSENAILTNKYLLFQKLAIDLANTATQTRGKAKRLLRDKTGMSIEEIETARADSLQFVKDAIKMESQAIEVLDRLMEKFPDGSVPFDENMVGVANIYMRVGQDSKVERPHAYEKAQEVARIVEPRLLDKLEWAASHANDSDVGQLVQQDLNTCGSALGDLVDIFRITGDQAAADALDKAYKDVLINAGIRFE